jgi:hypothetical protein
VLLLIAPISYASSLLLILAPNTFFLVIAGVLQGFFLLTSIVSGAMGAELVPKEHLGRWMGMQGLVRGMLSVPMPILGGWIWDFAGPQYLFVTAIGLDLLIRIPLLSSMPETLGGRFNVRMPDPSA